MSWRSTVMATLALVSMVGGAASPPAVADLTIEVRSLRNGTGVVGAALFDEEKASAFPDGEPLRTASALASPTGVALVFTDLPAGRYAIALIHDENENGELDTNEYGMPSEGFGFSNSMIYMGGD